MNIELKTIDNLNAELFIQLAPEDYHPKVEKKLKEYRKNAQISGFRKGMVPEGHLRRLYGKQIKAQESNELAHSTMSDYIEKNNVQFYGSPMLNIDKSDFYKDVATDEVLTYVYDLGLRISPKIELSKKDKITRNRILITDETIDQYIKDSVIRYGTMQDVETAGEEDLLKGNFIQLDADGNEMEDGILVDEGMISMRFVKQNKELFTGKKVGETIVFNPKTTLENPAEIAHLLKIEKEDAENLDCNFQYTITSIKRMIPATIDETLFDKMYKDAGIKTEEEFRKQISADMEKNNRYVEQHLFDEQLRKYLLGKFQVEMPEEFLKRWLEQRNENLTIEDIEKDWAKISNDIKWQTIVDEFAKTNNIKIEDEDVLEQAKDLVKSYLQQYGTSINIPEETLTSLAKSHLEKSEDVERLAERAINAKVITKITETIEVEELFISDDEFFNIK